MQLYGFAALIVLNFFPVLHGPTRYGFFALLIASVYAVWRQPGPLWIATPIDVPLLGLLLWVLFTVPFSIDPDYSFKEWRKLGAQVLLFYWAVRVLAMQPTRQRLWPLLVALMVGTALTATISLVEFSLHGGSLYGRDVRAGVFGSDYNWLSTYMVMALPLTLAVALLARKGIWRFASWVTVGLAAVAELFAYTRAGWMGLGAEALVALWWAGRRRVVVGVLLLAICAGLAYAATTNFRDPNETAALHDPWTLRARVDVWSLAAGDIAAHPFVGIGYGSKNFTARYAGRPELEKAAGAHSLFIMLTLGSGLPALGLFVWLVVATVSAQLRASRSLRMMGEPWHMLSVAAAVMLIGFAVRNLFDVMLIGGLANLFWMLVAMSFQPVLIVRRSVETAHSVTG
ncbi:MAG: O-antigen ligase family protein [Nitrospiraceae bacterium]